MTFGTLQGRAAAAAVTGVSHGPAKTPGGDRRAPGTSRGPRHGRVVPWGGQGPTPGPEQQLRGAVRRKTNTESRNESQQPPPPRPRGDTGSSWPGTDRPGLQGHPEGDAVQGAPSKGARETPTLG